MKSDNKGANENENRVHRNQQEKGNSESDG